MSKVKISNAIKVLGYRSQVLAGVSTTSCEYPLGVPAVLDIKTQHI
jgi:hypothetical protein